MLELTYKVIKGELIMIESYKRFWNNLFNFSGTSDRPDYWWPVIINYVLGIIIAAIIEMLMGHPLSEITDWQGVAVSSAVNIVMLIVWIGTLSVKIRRLHDSNHVGWWVLISIIPLIGTIWFFILMVEPSRQNRWSDNPTE